MVGAGSLWPLLWAFFFFGHNFVVLWGYLIYWCPISFQYTFIHSLMGSNIRLLEIDVGKYYLQPRGLLLLLLLRSVKRTKGSWISVCQIISTQSDDSTYITQPYPQTCFATCLNERHWQRHKWVPVQTKLRESNE
jgi:hypothetical protein